MQEGLVDVYQSEQDAERATHNGDYLSAVQHHNNSITKLNLLVSDFLQKNQTDEFGALDSLVILKNQILSRINQLKLLHHKEKEKEKKNVKLNDTGTPAVKSNVSTPIPSVSQNATITNANSNISIQLFNSTLAEIETSLLKNMNINISDVPKNPKSWKVPMINKEQISQLEHSLQLLNFKNSNDTQLKNEYFSKLNMLYYSEMMAQQKIIKDVVTVIKDVETSMETNPSWQKINQITDSGVYDIISDLHKQIAGLERDKIHMENEIVRLKERWHELVERVTKRKEEQGINNVTGDSNGEDLQN